MALAGPRKAAKEAGLTRYFTGKPCRHGHISERFVSTKACVTCTGKQGAKWYAERPEERRKAKQKWKAKNLDRELEAGRQRRKAYYQNNQAKVFSLNKRRRSVIRQRTPVWADLKAIDAVYEEAKRRRLAGEDVVVDHIFPLQGKQVSGLHVHTNLRIICRRENARKSNKLLERFQNGLHP